MGGIRDMLCIGVEALQVFLVLGATNFLLSFDSFMCRCYGLLPGWTPILRVLTRLILFDVTRKLVLVGVPHTVLFLRGLT